MIRFMFNIKSDWIMKRISIFVMAAVLLSLCGLVSCTSETETSGSGDNSVVTRSVVFNISLPTGDPIHVGTRAIQDNAEYSLKSLKMVVVDAAYDKVLSIVDVPINGLTGNNSGNDYKYTYDYGPQNEGKTCRFLFVANDPLTGLAVDETWSAVESKLLSCTFTANEALATTFGDANGLPMTGIAYYKDGGNAKNEAIPLGGTLDAAINVEVELTRAVARIDVCNYTPNLYISEVRLVHANNGSYLLPHTQGSPATTAIPNTVTKIGGGSVSGLQPFTAISTTTDYATYNSWKGSNATDDGNGYFGTHLKKAFYCYEDDIDENTTPSALEAEALALQVWGRLGDSYANGVDVFYQIPFIDKYLQTPDDNNKSVEIKRNNLYKVIIGNGTAVEVNDRVRMSLTVSDWTSQTVSSVFEDKMFVSEPGTWGSYNRNTQLITLNDNSEVTTGGGNDLTIKVSDSYATTVSITGIEVSTSGYTWTALNATTASSDWLTATVTTVNNGSDYVTLSATTNSSGNARIGSIRITYSYVDGNSQTVAGQKTVFSVKQPAPVTP